jgi:hypothetical protein
MCRAFSRLCRVGRQLDKAQITAQFEALATYLRPPEMQELLLKGDRYSMQKFGVFADKSPIPYANGADAARTQAANTARGLLVDCQVALACHVIAV